MQDVAAFNKLAAGTDFAAINFFKSPKDNFTDTNDCTVVAKIRHYWNIDISMGKIVMRQIAVHFNVKLYCIFQFWTGTVPLLFAAGQDN